MMTNAVLLDEGMKCLIKNLGEVDAERFITEVIREPFDYTKWQRGLFPGMSIEEISAAAVKYCKENPR